MKNVHEIEIKVEGKEWEDAITKSFNKNVQNVKVDGFRKGKVPRNIFEKKFVKIHINWNCYGSFKCTFNISS